MTDGIYRKLQKKRHENHVISVIISTVSPTDSSEKENSTRFFRLHRSGQISLLFMLLQSGGMEINMALMEIHFFSNTLGREVSVNALIPQGKEHYKTLLLLHGLSDDHTAWQRYTSVELYANAGGFAVIMPNADRSFYTDMAQGDRYFTYVSQELPEVMRGFFAGMSDKREDNFVAGLSMGGYGAFKIALTYPERYRAACSLSGALDIPFMVKEYMPGNRRLFETIFGNPDEVEGSENDLMFLLEKNVREGKELPSLFLACGTEDRILPCSRHFFEKAKDLGHDVFYKDAVGNHNWTFWNKHLKDFTEYISKL